ncbi:glutamyl-tRNA reductase [Streptomyces sp. NPDC048417]|uniref:glutamyl-tRNA reductase n=1 Tax=Streptomyces sp. NPDC048417 TaxID=3155387 RepID=UPI003440ED87
MSVLAVGLSHKSAPMAVLERASVTGDTLGKLLHDVAQAEPVAEAFVVSTCNRIEVYADVDRFHAGVTEICELLARHSGVPLDDLTPHLYVHYEDRAVSHLLAVACGLDSVVVGEEQVVGQVRAAIKLAAQQGTIGRVLGDLGRVAQRAGKRARAETGIGRAGAGLLGLAVELASPRLGEQGLAGRDVLVLGAGSMSALAVVTAARSGAAGIVVANRTRGKAERLVARPGATGTRAVGLGDLPATMAEADVVICCTGAAGPVITADMVPAERRGSLVFLDLAMPRDVEPAVADLPGVMVVGMDALSEHRAGAGTDEVAAVRAILESELAAYRSAVDAARVAPVVVALRAKAAGVVDAELARLAGRLTPDAPSGRVLDEMAQTIRRVVDKLLHEPTVRVKELAGSPKGEDYAAALRVLFDLEPRAVQAVTRAPTPGQEELP